MPVNPERRYFIRDGKVLCHHAYWIQEAIEASYKPPSEKQWREISEILNFEGKNEAQLLSNYALQVAKVIDGFWSVDCVVLAEINGWCETSK